MLMLYIVGIWYEVMKVFYNVDDVWYCDWYLNLSGGVGYVIGCIIGLVVDNVNYVYAVGVNGGVWCLF